MLERFLPSVVVNTTGDAEVIIADNGSTDDSIEFLKKSADTINCHKWRIDYHSLFKQMNIC